MALDFLDDEPEYTSEAKRLREQTIADLTLPRLSDEEADRALGVVPKAIMPVLPDANAQRDKLMQTAWRSLSEPQRVFLLTWRDENYSERAAIKAMAGTQHEISRGTVRRTWANDDDFQFVRKVLMNSAYEQVVDKAKLVLRADEVAERALEPRPILHKGLPTGFFEFDADVVLRANEQILKVGGHMKIAESVRVKVRIVNLAGPDDDKVIDGTAVDVEVETPDFLS